MFLQKAGILLRCYRLSQYGNLILTENITIHLGNHKKCVKRLNLKVCNTLHTQRNVGGSQLPNRFHIDEFIYV